MGSPTIVKIESLGIMADRRAYRVTTQYHGDPTPITAVFQGPTGEYGPVVMLWGHSGQVFVENSARFGPFGENWVRNFYAW